MTVVTEAKSGLFWIIFEIFLIIVYNINEVFFLQGKLHIEYLGTSDEYRSEALFANARQMLAQYQRKRIQKEEETLPIFYWPYTSLTPDKEVEFIATIRNYLKQSQFDAAVSIIMCCRYTVGTSACLFL